MSSLDHIGANGSILGPDGSIGATNQADNKVYPTVVFEVLDTETLDNVLAKVPVYFAEFPTVQAPFSVHLYAI